MKRIILIAAILTAGLICNAQYNYYNPYIDAAIASVIISETDEMYKLDNIRFDENAIRQNPDAWANYMNYLEFDADYNKKIKTYGTIAWVGLGVAFTSLIPLCMDLGYDYDDPRSDLAIDWGISLLCVGGVAFTCRTIRLGRSIR